jgi:hypothetical protein
VGFELITLAVIGTDCIGSYKPNYHMITTTPERSGWKSCLVQSKMLLTEEFESRSGEVYSIQRYVIKFVSDLRQVGGFLRVFRFPPPIKLTATM